MSYAPCQAVRRSETGEYVPVEPSRADAIARNTVEAVQRLVVQGLEPVVLTTAQVRRYFKRIVDRQLPKTVVLSYNEVDPSVTLVSEGQIGA